MDEYHFDDMGELLKQPFSLTMSGNKYTIQEQRVLVRCVEALQAHMTYGNLLHGKEKWQKATPDYFKIMQSNIGDLTISVATKKLLASSTDSYQMLRRALIGLTKKSLLIKKKDETGKVFKEIVVNLASKVVFNHRSEQVSVKIDADVVPLLTDLQKGYTQYLLGVAFNSSSSNVFKIYGIISHFRDKPQVNILLSDLKRILALEEKYKKPAHLKRGILDPAAKELKEKADVWFEVAEPIKEGRRMLGWKLNIYTKKGTKKTKTVSPQLSESPLIQRLISQFDLSPRQAQEVAAKAPEKELNKILYDIQLLKINDKITNLGGYTAKVLSEKFNIKL